MGDKLSVVRGSGNVFADLGLANPDEWLLKSQLVTRIQQIIERKGLTQAKAAQIVGLDQPKISHLLHGRLAGFSVGRLSDLLNRLGHAVEVHVSERELPASRARTVVVSSRPRAVAPKRPRPTPSKRRQSRPT